MSLLENAMEPVVMMEKDRQPDGEGGFIVNGWNQTVEFKAAISFDTSMSARTAEKAGVTSLYTVTTAKNVTLEARDVFKRIRDGKIFRVTSDGDDKATPDSASINMRQVTAEEWRLT